jgi:hypothetical protein
MSEVLCVYVQVSQDVHEDYLPLGGYCFFAPKKSCFYAAVYSYCRE